MKTAILTPDDDNLIRELRTNYTYASNAIEAALQADHERQAREAAKKGASVSFRNDRILADDLREHAAQSIAIAHDDALKAIEKQRGKAQKAVTDAPTDDEARYIVGINGRDDMSKKEIEAGLNRYKGHAAQHAILAAAKRSGFKDYPSKTESEARLDMLDMLQDRVAQDFSYSSLIGTDNVRRSLIVSNFESIIKNGGEMTPQALNDFFSGASTEEQG